MPHATEAHDIEEQDRLLIEQVLQNSKDGLDFSQELEPGEKAEDAQDFADVSDEDLPEEEEADGAYTLQEFRTDQEGDSATNLDSFRSENGLLGVPDGTSPEDNLIDELFMDEPSFAGNPDFEPAPFHRQSEVDLVDFDEGQQEHSQDHTVSSPNQQGPQDFTGSPFFSAPGLGVKDTPVSKDFQRQQQLFAMSRNGTGNLDYLPAPPENQAELLASLWPKFKRDTVPRFMDLLPPKKARYLGKTIVKPPKAINPSKVTLDLAQDQEKSFKFTSKPMRSLQDDTGRPGMVEIYNNPMEEDTAEEEMDTESDFDEENVGGLSWSDLQMICEDWETPSDASSVGGDSFESHERVLQHKSEFRDSRQNWDGLDEVPPAKRRKVDHTGLDTLHAPRFSLSSLQDPQEKTSKIARTVTLDLNDSRLLIDRSSSMPAHSSGRIDLKNAERGAFTKGLSRRYNISNDEAYDLLKENHQSKVRGMLGNITVEHSLPALRLQWPFYKTKLEKAEARSFHRPSLRINRNEHVSFSKPAFVKRKHLKGRDTQSIFGESKDLSLGDNSNILLLEYSEENPTMMSNVGMGNRVINYYRRTNMEDTSRPKLDIGETAVLLPQDKSPFSLFGHVDPGQTTPTLYNSMYRAPLFKQGATNQDFLIVKTSTGVNGSFWYLRNIENLYVVGQEFPSVDVPGPHSRKVTTASKNRLKMISYRLARKNKTHRISVGEVTSHFIDSTDMQNRQKMKEFMQFNKEHKEWQMRSGESIPDERTVRAMVKAEEVCLLESMQVGQQHLQDAGFSKGDDESEGDEAKEGQSIEEHLAPWFTSRNFLHATQGKAMLTLHGEGDPSGRGEAFSFIKTSMKGGFKAADASATEKMRARQMKDSNGHAYNVQEQQKSYEESIRRIWDAQKRSLSSTVDQSDFDVDMDSPEEATNNTAGAATPRSEAPTPATLRRRDDETTSQYTQATHASTGSQAGKTLRITRYFTDEDGDVRPVSVVVKDPKVIRQYLKRRQAIEEATTGISELVPTGNPELDRRNKQRLEAELARLKKNKERRIMRDKQKGVHFDGSQEDPGSPSSPAVRTGKGAGTPRKCANCGLIGHIKTNKKLCPMLNGTLKPEEGFGSSAFTVGNPMT